MSLLKWAYNAKAHIRQPVLDNLLYGLELDVRALLQFPDSEPVYKTIPVYSLNVIDDVLELRGMDRVRALRHMLQSGSVSLHGVSADDLFFNKLNLTDEEIESKILCLPRIDFMIEIEHGEDFVLYDMVGMSNATRSLRQFAKDNFESYRYRSSPGQRFLPLYYGRNQALRIDATDLTLRALIGKRISKETLTGVVE